MSGAAGTCPEIRLAKAMSFLQTAQSVKRGT